VEELLKISKLMLEEQQYQLTTSCEAPHKTPPTKLKTISQMLLDMPECVKQIEF
jgi:hypothetical protein